MKKHYDGKLYECHCGSVFKSKHRLKTHQKRHTGEMKNTSRNTFHILRNHRNSTVFCDLCPRSFYRKTSLAIHMKRDHLNNLPFICKVCGHGSIYERDHKIHRQLHGSECQVCHKVVRRMCQHLKWHDEEKCTT